MQAAGLARDAAREHDQAATLAVASWGTSVALFTGGMTDLAQAELDSITLPWCAPSVPRRRSICCQGLDLLRKAQSSPTPSCGC